MPTNDEAQSAPIDELASELTDSLKNCRSMVRDYRSKLGAPAPAADNDVPSPVDADAPRG